MSNINTYKRISRLLTVLVFLLLVFCCYCAFTNTWLANDINRWQMSFLGERKFYPALTMFVLFLPAGLLLVPVKKWLTKKIEKSRKY